MKIKKGLILREVAGSYIVVAVGNMAKNFNSIINLNESSALLWKELEKGAEKDDLIEVLLSKYQVERALAQNDVEKFLLKLTEAGLVE